MTRAEHVKWCKQRAMEYVAAGDLTNAVASMLSDLSQHDETRGIGEKLGMLGILYASHGDRQGVIRFIQGFAE